MPVAKISESSMTKLIKKALELGVSVKDYLDALISDIDVLEDEDEDETTVEEGSEEDTDEDDDEEEDEEA